MHQEAGQLAGLLHVLQLLCSRQAKLSPVCPHTASHRPQQQQTHMGLFGSNHEGTLLSPDLDLRKWASQAASVGLLHCWYCLQAVHETLRPQAS